MKRLLISLFILTACAPFQDSPFSDQLIRSERNINAASLQRITGVEDDGKIRIAVFSDSHQNYKDLDQAIFQINQATDLDFVINLGDMTNSAYNFEYNQFLDSIHPLRYPLLSVLGNHDSIGAGPSLFRKMFGDSNFWFESASRRYIFFNSNNLENPAEFDPDWLLATVNSSTKPIFIFSHVNLRDPERYFSTVATTFDTVIKHPKVQLILNGHNHVWGLDTDNGTTMLEVPRVEGPAWLILEVQSNQLDILRMDKGSTTSVSLKP